MPWFTVGIDTVFHVPRKVLIEHGAGSVSFQRGDHAPRSFARWLGRFEHDHGSIALFDDDLHALPHLLQHSMHVARKLGLCHVNSHDISHQTSADELLVQILPFPRKASQRIPGNPVRSGRPTTAPRRLSRLCTTYDRRATTHEGPLPGRLE